MCVPDEEVAQGAPIGAWGVPIIRTSTNGDQMEVLTNDILALIDALESDIEVEDFDAEDDSEMLN